MSTFDCNVHAKKKYITVCGRHYYLVSTIIGMFWEKKKKKKPAQLLSEIQKIIVCKNYNIKKKI